MRNRPRLSLLLVSLFTLSLADVTAAQQTKAAATSSKNDNSEHLIDYPKLGVDLGNGWNSLTGKKMNAVCVTFDQKEDTGQDTTENLTSITDQYSLMNEMHISAEAEVSALGTTVSSKMNYATKTTVNNEYSNFIVRAVVENGARFLIPEKERGVIGLTPMALNLAKTNLLRFEQVCGDTFVSSLHGGAELDAVITFTTRSQEDHQSLEVSFAGSGWGVEAKASGGGTVESLRKNGQMKITYYQSGGSGDPLATDQDKLNTLINGLPLSAANNPKLFQLGLTRYDSLADWPGNSSGWHDVVYRDLAAQYFKLNSLYTQTTGILANQSAYIFDQGLTVEQFKTVSDRLQSLTKDIKGLAQKCFSSAGAGCELPAQYRLSDYTFRARMPVARGSFQTDVDLPKATAELAAATSSLNAVQNEINNSSGGIFSCKVNIGFCPELKAKLIIALAAQADATAKLTQLRAQYPRSLKATIARTWLESVNTARCTRDVLDSGCTSLADLDTYIATINTPINLNAGTVPLPPAGLTAVVK